MSCSVTERVTENRAGPGGGPTTGPGAGGGTAGCRLRGSSSASLGTPPISRGGVSAASTQNGPQAGQGAPLRPKPCCLCWCCCCSCSWSWKKSRCKLSASGSTPGKGNDENGPTRNSNNSDLLNYDGDPPPSLEEIRSWGRSFDKLMRSSAGRKVFRDFLRCEYSEENILFWLACEDLKRENNPEVVEEKARIIYEDYISILSPKEVSLDARVREIVNRNMVEPTPHTFDEAQLQIYTLMHRDSYPRFVNSPLYRSLAQQQSQDQQGDKEERASEDNAPRHNGGLTRPRDSTVDNNSELGRAKPADALFGSFLTRDADADAGTGGLLSSATFCTVAGGGVASDNSGNAGSSVVS